MWCVRCVRAWLAVEFFIFRFQEWGIGYKDEECDGESDGLIEGREDEGGGPLTWLVLLLLDAVAVSVRCRTLEEQCDDQGAAAK